MLPGPLIFTLLLFGGSPTLSPGFLSMDGRPPAVAFGPLAFAAPPLAAPSQAARAAAPAAPAAGFQKAAPGSGAEKSRLKFLAWPTATTN